VYICPANEQRNTPEAMTTTTTTASQKQAQAAARVAAMPTAQLVEAFELTNGNTDPAIPKVREWLMNEMEARNPEAFLAWLESVEDSPRSFLLK
jgi:hypothetical protein